MARELTANATQTAQDLNSGKGSGVSELRMRFKKLIADAKAYAKDHPVKTTIASVVAAVLLIGGVYHLADAVVGENKVSGELAGANGQITQTINSGLTTFNTTVADAEIAIKNAIEANEEAQAIYQLAVNASTYEEAQQVWEKAKGDVTVAQYSSRAVAKTVYQQAYEAHQNTTAVKSSVETSKNTLEGFNLDQVSNDLKQKVNDAIEKCNILLKEDSIVQVATYNGTTITPAQALSVKYSAETTAQTSNTTISSVAYADIIANNAVTIADASAQIAQSKMNESKLNPVTLSETQVSQIADAVKDDFTGGVLGLQSQSYIGDKLVLYFDGVDGADNAVVFRVSLDATQLKYKNSDNAEEFSKEVCDYINSGKADTEILIGSESVTDEENADKNLNFSVGDTPATLKDVVFNIETKYLQKANATLIAYDAYVVGEDGLVFVQDSGSYTVNGKNLSVEEARAYVVEQYLLAHAEKSENTPMAEIEAE